MATTTDTQATISVIEIFLTYVQWGFEPRLCTPLHDTRQAKRQNVFILLYYYRCHTSQLVLIF